MACVVSVRIARVELANMSATNTRRLSVKMPAGLHISAYDRVAGLIVALLVIVGFGVCVLVLLWLADRALTGAKQPPVELVSDESSDGLQALGVGDEMVEPGVEEFADITAPQLADSLAAVTTAVTMQQATLDELFGSQEEMGSGRGAGNRNVEGAGGSGDLRTLSPERGISLRGTDAANYANLLDTLGIEMGVLGGGLDGITYVSQFTAEQPVVREGTGDLENRFYFSQDSNLVEFDRQLLAKAGIASHNRVIVYFIPPDVERQILVAERDYQGRKPENILRTIFGIKPDGGEYKFYVIRQQAR